MARARAVKPLTMLEAIGVAFILGLVVAKVYQYKTVYSKSFVMSLALLPTLIRCTVFFTDLEKLHKTFS